MFCWLTRKLFGAAMSRQPCRFSCLPMGRLARPVKAGMSASRVSKAAASVCPPETPLSQSRIPGPLAPGSSVSPLPE